MFSYWFSSVVCCLFFLVSLLVFCWCVCMYVWYRHIRAWECLDVLVACCRQQQLGVYTIHNLHIWWCVTWDGIYILAIPSLTHRWRVSKLKLLDSDSAFLRRRRIYLNLARGFLYDFRYDANFIFILAYVEWISASICCLMCIECIVRWWGWGQWRWWYTRGWACW